MSKNTIDRSLRFASVDIH